MTSARLTACIPGEHAIYQNAKFIYANERWHDIEVILPWFGDSRVFLTYQFAKHFVKQTILRHWPCLFTCWEGLPLLFSSPCWVHRELPVIIFFLYGINSKFQHVLTQTIQLRVTQMLKNKYEVKYGNMVKYEFVLPSLHCNVDELEATALSAHYCL